MYITTDL